LKEASETPNLQSFLHKIFANRLAYPLKGVSEIQ